MHAVRFHHFGSPNELQLEELLTPELTRGEVLVEIHAASVNPSDVKNVQGNMEHTTLLRTPGRDFAGVVVAGAEDLIGVEVWGTGGDVGFTRDGSHASDIVLPVGAVQPKPRNLSMEEAATVGVAYVTAWLSIIEAAQLQAGETLLVIGATGAVGSAAIQIAKWKGARVLGTVRREADTSAVEQAGVDKVINLSTEDLGTAVFAATENVGAAVVFDTVGGEMAETSLAALAHKGRLVEISAPASHPRISFDLRDFYHRELRLFGVDSRAVDVTGCGTILAALTPGFEAGALHPPTSIETYPLEEVVKAYEQVLNRNTTSKVVLSPSKKQ